MNINEFSGDSDTSDEDYTPGGKTDDIPSEVDSDGDSEDPLSESEELKSRTGKRKITKKQKTKNKLKPQENTKETVVLKSEDDEKDQKKKVDDLWADFMKDTGFQSKNGQKSTTNSNNSTPNLNRSGNANRSETSVKQLPQKTAEKIKITQLFEFAGEEVQVEKEVAVDSAEARLLSHTADNDIKKAGKGKRIGGLSGIGNVLSQLSKKPKISTLEKTKLDWDRFKKDHNIEEELQIHNKGKDGYLERQDFLQRADLRRFEIEKEIRSVERNKRFNSAL